MTQIVRMPDGQQVGFPDDMPRERIRELISSKYPNAEREAAARTGVDPYQTDLETYGAAISNVPGNIRMGIGGMQQSGAELVNSEITDFFDRLGPPNEARPDVFSLSDRPETQEFNFINWAKEQIGADPASPLDANQRAQIEAIGQSEEGRAAYQAFITENDPAIGPSATAAAEDVLRTTLGQEQIAAGQTPIDAPPGSWHGYIAQAVGSVGEMTPALAASIALRNPIPAMAWMGIQSGGRSYTEGRVQGLPPEEARAFATLNAIAEGIPEALPLHVILRGSGPLISRFVQGAAAEGIQEGFTEGLQFLIEKGMLDPDMTWGEALPRIRDASIVGGIAGGMMVGATSAMQPGLSAAGNAASEVSRQVFETLNAKRQEIINGTFDTLAELGDTLKGATLQERVDAFAEVQRIYDEAQRGETTAGVDAVLEGAVGDALVPDAGVVPPAETASDISTVDRIIGIESGGNPTAQNPNSSAGGLGQFTNGTWLQTVRQHAPEFADRSRAAILAMKLDTSPEGLAFHRRMLEALTNDNRQGLVAAGIEPTDGNIYLAHFLGLGGAQTALNADPEASVRSVMGDAVVNANPFLENMTIGEMVQWAARKMGSSTGAGTIRVGNGGGRADGFVGQFEDTGQTDTTGATIPEQEVIPVEDQAAPEREAAVPTEPTDLQPIPQATPIAEVEVITPTGERVTAQPEIVDIANLRPAGEDLQPRDRSRAASDAQIEDIAINLDPARLQVSLEADRGAPIVGPDGIVESGNGRIAALRRAYEAYPEKAEAYRQALREQGYTVPDDGMPVLISRRTSELTPEQRRAFVVSANTSGIARMSSTEAAVNDARLIDAATLSSLEPGANPAARGSSFAKAFLNRLPQSERSSLVDKDGQLNADGVRRIQNALMAAAYGDPETIARAAESTEDNARSITGALVDVAAEWAALKQGFASGELDSAYDMSPHLTEALRVLSRARDKAAQQGRPVKALINEAINQTDMLGGEVTIEAEQFIRAFYNGEFSRAKSREHIGEFLRTLISDIQSAAQPQLLGDAPQPGDIIDAARQRTDRDEGKQPDIFASRRDGKRSSQSRKEDGEPRVQRASPESSRRDEGAAQQVTDPNDDSIMAMETGDRSRSRAKPAREGRTYPLAPKSEWYANANYEDTGGVLSRMSPDEFLGRARPLKIDDVSRDNIDDLKSHIEAGRTLDPLLLYEGGKEDGRHRAVAAKELGIEEVPVLLFGDQIEGEPETWDALTEIQGTLEYNPGPGHVRTWRERGMPARPADNKIKVTGGDLTLRDEPTKRDEPRKKLLAVIGDRLYQRKVKGRNRLGFYRQRNSEVRVKFFDDIEVMAHEAAHFLDFDKSLNGRFTKLRKDSADELNDLSYTTERSVINAEGFAEYVRLWATDYPSAVEAAPAFTKKFEAAINDAGVGRQMRAFQKSAHRWYWQGTLAQFRGKSGASSNFIDNFNGWLRSRPFERFLQGFVDRHYAKKVIERETTGKISDATRSAWKLGRMTAGSASMTEAVMMYGTPQIAADGSYEFRGKSLMDVFMPVTKKKDGAKRFDLLMEYFKARRARELMIQGRENLFTGKEIQAGLDYAKQYPEFEQVFEDWKTFNGEMLDFYVEMDLITPEQRDAFEANNTEYVPFHRVIEEVGGNPDAGAPRDIDKRLYGGEQNTREIAQNIADGLGSNIQAALASRAKAQLFRNIRASQKGSEFAAKLSPGSKPLKLGLEQYRSRFAEILTALGYEVEIEGQVLGPPNARNAGDPIDMADLEALLNDHPELLQFWMHNQKPSTTGTIVEPVIIDGELNWFEVNSPLLANDLAAIGAASSVIRLLSFPKRFLTKAITSMPQFMGPNLVRDTTNAAALTQSKFRPFAESLRGMKSYLRKDERFKTFALNGGMFSGRIDADGNIIGERAKKKAKAQLQQMGVPPENGFELAGRLLSTSARFAVPFEMGSRVGQFERAMDTGVNPLEATFQGREISTDFAQMGRNEVWRAFLQITPFANAGLQGIDQMTRHLFEANGKVRPNLKSARKFGVQAFTRFGATMTVATALLWLLNHDDDRYKELTVDQKARYWHLWLPTGHHLQIPKPYGVGFIFADLPEISLDYIATRDGDAAARQLAFGMAQHFWFLDYPAFLQPSIEAMQNKKFTGAPIVPQSLQDVEPAFQYTDRTPEIYRQLGKTLGISPLIAEHYTRGFLGYVESYMVDATEEVLWNEEAWGERPFARNVLDYFTWQFNGQEIPYRTKWTEGYYELRQRSRTAAATFNHLFRQSQRSTGDLTEFTESEINLMLRELNTMFTRVDRSFSEGNAYLMSIKYDPDLDRETKERRIELWYKRRNDELGDVYRRADEIVSKMERDQQ